MRTSAIVSQTLCAASNGFPVVIIHEGNHLLEQQLRANFSGSGRYKEISSGNPCFEPFYGLSELEISNQILETAPKDYDIKYNARYYIEGISAYLKASGKNLSFKLFSTCPHSMIFDKVDDLEMQGKISDHEAQEIKSKLMMGQSENYKLDSFLASLRMEIEPLMYVSKRGQHPLNIVTALKHNAVLCFDLSSVTNKLLLNTVIYQLKLALTRGLQYQIVIDSIPIDSNESYKMLFDLALKEALGRTKSQGNVYFICDEFKLLPNLQHIDDGVNFGRSLGVKVFAGLQSIEQLYEIYGQSRGKNLAAGFSSIIAFRANDVTTREYISSLHGKNMVLEQYRMLNNTMVEEKRIGSTVED